MIYYIVKIFIQLYFRVYFKKIYILNNRVIPRNKAVFLASNHPNGFLDGTIVAAVLTKPLYIFVRGDVFRKKWSNFLLRGIKLIPIFRVRDGDVRQSVMENSKSYDQLYHMFRKKAQVMIFPESDSVPVKRLRGLKKGTARILLDMIGRDQGRMKVDVVPTGLNYSFYRSYGKELTMCFSPAINIEEIRANTKTDSEAMIQFTNKLHGEIARTVVSLDPEWEDVGEMGLELIDGFKPLNFNVISHDDSVFKLQWNLAETLKKEGKGGPFHLHIRKLYNKVKLLKMTSQPHKPSMLKVALAALLLVPSYLASIPVWALFEVGTYLANLWVSKAELYDSVLFGIALFLGVVIDITALILLISDFNPLWLAGYVVFRVLSIYFLNSLDIIKRYLTHRKWMKIKREDPDYFAEISELQRQFLGRISTSV